MTRTASNGGRRRFTDGDFVVGSLGGALVFIGAAWALGAAMPAVLIAAGVAMLVAVMV